MTSPRWYRANLWAVLAPYVVGAVTLALVALGAWVALQQYGARRYEAGRASLMQESHDWLKASNDQWRRVAAVRHDTVRVLDTVVVTRVVRARAVAATIQDSLTVRAAVHDSAPSLYEGPLRACGAQLDSLANDCDRFRASALAALAAKDSAIAALDKDGAALAVIARDAMTQAGKEAHRNQQLSSRHRALRWVWAAGGALVTWRVMR